MTHARNLLVIRDSDSENDYVADGEINIITIDLGGSWSSTSAFFGDLEDGDNDAIETRDSHLAEVADLAPDNPVRRAVEEFFNG